jgi:hypothetical protein
MKEQYTRQDIDATQAELDKKKQDVTDDQQAISDLEDDLHRTGGDPGWDREDTPPAAAATSSTPSSPNAAEPAPGSQPGQSGEVVTPPETSTPPPTPAPEPSTTPDAPATTSAPPSA